MVFRQLCNVYIPNLNVKTIKVYFNENKNYIYFYLIVYFLNKRCYIDVNNSHFHNNFQEDLRQCLRFFLFWCARHGRNEF